LLPRPLLYLDTNIFLDLIRNRTGELADASKKLFREIEDDKYGVITSSFTSLEIMEDEQERVYAEREIFICKKSFDEVRRHIDRRDLTPSELAGIKKNLENRVYKPFMDKEKIILKYLTDEGWIRAYQLLDQLNISASDCIHLAIADIAGCDIFVTNDEQLRDVGSSFFKLDIMVFSSSLNIENGITELVKARKEKLEKKE
jgi:predicted nucleic acid-binding protein